MYWRIYAPTSSSLLSIYVSQKKGEQFLCTLLSVSFQFCSIFIFLRTNTTDTQQSEEKRLYFLMSTHFIEISFIILFKQISFIKKVSFCIPTAYLFSLNVCLLKDKYFPNAHFSHLYSRPEQSTDAPFFFLALSILLESSEFARLPYCITWIGHCSLHRYTKYQLEFNENFEMM